MTEIKENEDMMKNEYLGREPIGKLLVRFAIPCVLSMLVSALYNIVDQIFIGQGVGYLGNAATNVVYPFTVVALALALLIGDGSAALLSLSLGRKKLETARKSVGNGIAMTALLAAVLTAAGFIWRANILELFGVTEACRGYAVEYMNVILIGIPFYVFTSAVNGVIRADGSPGYSMIATVAGAVINLILDPIAIFALNMGVTGAAAATVIGQVATCVMSALYFRRTKLFSLKREDFRLEPEILKQVLRLGASSLIIQLSIVAVMAAANNLIVAYGPESVYGAEIPLSVIGIVMKVFAIVIAFAVGIAVGGQPIAGYNYGAGRYSRVLSTYKCIIFANIIVGAAAMLLFELCPQMIVNLFGSEGALYNEYADMCFRIFLGGILLCCMQKASSIFLQSIGKPVKSTILSLARDVIFFIPALLILTPVGGVEGMLWAAPAADILAFAMTVVLIAAELGTIRKRDAKNSVTAGPAREWTE